MRHLDLIATKLSPRLLGAAALLAAAGALVAVGIGPWRVAGAALLLNQLLLATLVLTVVRSRSVPREETQDQTARILRSLRSIGQRLDTSSSRTAAIERDLRSIDEKIDRASARTIVALERIRTDRVAGNSGHTQESTSR